MKSRPKVVKSAINDGLNHQCHEFGPFVFGDTQVLILGSFPSVKSREMAFYYGHPSNRFYSVLAALFDEAVALTLTEKKDFLKRHHIGLYDVIESCDIQGSADSSIRNVVLTDIDGLHLPQLKLIVLNGKTAARYDHGRDDVPHVVLPSTSSANAAYSLQRLKDHWKVIVDYLEQ